MKCTHCGSKVRVGAEKCPNCGGSEFTETDVPAGSTDTTASFDLPSGGRGSAMLPIALFGGFAVLVLVGGGLLLTLRAGPPSSHRPPDQQPAVATSSNADLRGFAAVREQGGLTVGVDPNAPPFMSRSGTGWEGFEYAIIAAIAENAKVPVEIVPESYDDILASVAAGTVDLGVAQLPPQTQDGVEFSKSYLQYSLCLIAPSANGAKRLKQVHTIGMYQDPTAIHAWERAGSGSSPRFYSDSGYLADVASGAIDAMLYDCPLARYELAHDPAGSKLAITNSHAGLGTYSIAVTSKIPGLRDDVDAALGDLGTSGVFPALAQRWLGESPPSSWEDEAAKAVVVAPGESFDAVATRVGVPAADLSSWNADILGTGPPSVYGGMLLRVR